MEGGCVDEGYDDCVVGVGDGGGYGDVGGVEGGEEGVFFVGGEGGEVYLGVGGVFFEVVFIGFYGVEGDVVEVVDFEDLLGVGVVGYEYDVGFFVDVYVGVDGVDVFFLGVGVEG